MRIDVLELVRYGHFSDRFLDFRKSGTSDLHLVFGPNEAGKSTIREGIGDILFKVPLRSKMTFATGTALRIGGRFTTGNGSFQVYRLKKNKDDLVDVEDAPVRGNPFATVTDGFAREFFDQTFSVDREQLEKGGDQILEGKGDLGQLLFAGSTGLQGLPERLAALDTEASQLWKPRGDAKIRVLIDQIKAIDDGIDAIKTTQRDYDDAVRDLTRLQIAYDEILARRGLRSKAIRESEIWLRAFTPYREHQRARAKLDALGSGETAGPGDLDRVQGALQELARLNAILSTARSSYDEIETRLEALPQVDPILAHALTIEDLRNRSVEARKEQADRPNREREVAESRATIERIGRELGLDSGAASRDLTIATRETTRLSGLLIEEARSRSALGQAEAEVARAETLVSEGARSLTVLGLAVDQAELRSILKSAENVDLGAEFRRLSGDRAQRAHEHSDILAAHGVTGADTEAQFLALVLPEDAEIERLGLTLRSAEQALAEASANLRAGLQAVDAAEQDLAALSDVQAISDDVLQNAKIERDAVVGALVWPVDESELSARRADLVERIRRTDGIYDDRIDQADALSDLKAKTVIRDRQALKVNHIEQEKAAAEAAISAARDAVRLVSPSAFVFRDIAHIRAVVTDQQKLRRLRAEINGFDHHLQLLAEQQTAQDAALRRSLLELGFAVDPAQTGGALRSFAQDRLDEVEDRNRTRQTAEATLCTAEQDLERRRRDLTSATGAREEMARQLRDALSETWIDRETDPESVREILTRLPELLIAQTDLQTATRRLAAMDENHRNGLEVLNRLRSQIDRTEAELSSDTDDFVPAAEVLVVRLGLARKRDEVEADLKTRLAKDEAAIAEAQAKIIETTARLADLQEKFATAEPDQLRVSVQQGIARGEIHTEIDRQARALLVALDVTSLDEAEAIMADLDDADLSVRKDALEAEQTDIDVEREQVSKDLTLAKRDLEKMTGSDEIARLLQDRESVKSELADLVRDYTRLRAGEKLLNWALTRFRQTNKAPMLASAGRFFARMTRDEYTDLITQPGDKGDILAARQRDGTLKTVDALSEGTRHQLFLALRMAGYLELSTGRDVPPLILDDILSSSDNARAAAMLEALSELAEAAQVIVLTHHAHVLEIATDVLPGRFTLHRLAESAA
jgi:uncharacterized protein YhaN